MKFYQVRANFYFKNQDDSADFFHDCDVALPKASVIHPLEENMEFSSSELIECNHDLTPWESCVLLQSIDNKPVSP